ncbi:hypothetical protein ILYODFUR_034902 [Ilyodon furcidens]|uniref:Uncharacterized protein n=1 Tax=Ilyodon furcidens TaxID=33524 RepID=A0ABV0TPN5_9TELE
MVTCFLTVSSFVVGEVMLFTFVYGSSVQPIYGLVLVPLDRFFSSNNELCVFLMFGFLFRKQKVDHLNVDGRLIVDYSSNKRWMLKKSLLFSPSMFCLVGFI